MGDTERTIDAVAVNGSWASTGSTPSHNEMALITQVGSTIAFEEGKRAAKHAFPVYKTCAMFGAATTRANTQLFHQAVLAEQVLLLSLSLLQSVHLLLAVDQATEVGLVAPVTQVESTPVVGELLRLAKVKVIYVCCHASVVEDALLFGADQSLLLDHCLKVKHRAELGHDRLGQTLRKFDL